jgi:hypothetical protein
VRAIERETGERETGRERERERERENGKNDLAIKVARVHKLPLNL